jgi:predicted DNA-binding protein with PD1-like motif
MPASDFRPAGDSPRDGYDAGMKSTIAGAQPVGRSYVVVLDLGDDVLERLGAFFDEECIAAAKFYGIGGFGRVTLGYYDMEEQRYLPIEVDEQVEVVSLIGNVATYRDEPRVHAHCTVGHRDGHTTGGHLLSGFVRPTLELVVEEIAAGLRRSDRPEIGIPLLDF